MYISNKDIWYNTTNNPVNSIFILCNIFIIKFFLNDY